MLYYAALWAYLTFSSNWPYKQLKGLLSQKLNQPTTQVSTETATTRMEMSICIQTSIQGKGVMRDLVVRAVGARDQLTILLGGAVESFQIILHSSSIV